MPNPPEITEQYRAAVSEVVLWRRNDRGLIEICGADRAGWLNNLVTNVVKALAAGEGNYAFATNVKGRTLFDLNLLVLEDRLWLDLDRRQTEAAIKHFDRHIITEDVRLADLSPTTGRLTIVGPRAHEAVAQMGLGNLVPMAQLQHVAGKIGGADVRMVRNDCVGLLGAELIVRVDDLAGVSDRIVQAGAETGIRPLDDAAAEVLRIEAGIPASIVDIDEEVVPPETGQVERGISYHKGCYLGQEVIERMRSHGVLARLLVGIRVEGDGPIARGAAVQVDSQEVGRVTSSCWSEAIGARLALGYVKTARANPRTTVTITDGDRQRSGVVMALPVRR